MEHAWAPRRVLISIRLGLTACLSRSKTKVYMEGIGFHYPSHKVVIELSAGSIPQ
jgi:hypothetical protein